MHGNSGFIGYARVSTQDQNSDFRVDALEKAGAEQIFQEKFAGKLRERLDLSQCLRMLRKGVWKLNRLARSVKDLVEDSPGTPSSRNRL
ncbi:MULTISPECIES: recombinase family protein [unclassified Marinobacter]|uniref:recombinase family protein n=1 Tax=unclassified Marinobacter TaxID=83889 RepID=UPI002265CA8B|nr:MULTISPECIES: recombinase family protein [unclassified Marinobacter]